MINHMPMNKPQIEMNDFYQRQNSSTAMSNASMPSLAESLRQRREISDKIEQERQIHGVIRLKKHQFKLNPRGQETGNSMPRIRPQATPRINLLKPAKLATPV